MYEGQLRSLLLDYIPIKVGHTGVAIADHIRETLVAFGLESSVSMAFGLKIAPFNFPPDYVRRR